MTEIISNIKPKVDPTPEVKIQYNDRSYDSFIKNGFPDLPRSDSSTTGRGF